MSQYLVNFSKYSWIVLKDNQVKMVGIGVEQVKLHFFNSKYLSSNWTLGKLVHLDVNEKN